MNRRRATIVIFIFLLLIILLMGMWISAFPPTNQPSNNQTGTFDFSILVEPNSSTVPQGNVMTVSSQIVNLTLINGSSQAISFSCSGLPTGAVCSTFSPISCKPNCSSSFSITTNSSTPTGTFSIAILAMGSGITRSATFTLTTQHNYFAISSSPQLGSVAPGNSLTANVMAVLLSGSVSNISFSCSGLPANSNCTFTPNNCLPPCSSQLTLSTDPSTPIGKYDISVSAASNETGRTALYVMNVTYGSLSMKRKIVASNIISQTEGSIVVSPVNNMTLAAAFTYREPFRSLDGGATWFNNPYNPYLGNISTARGDQWAAFDSSGNLYTIIWWYADGNLSSPTYLSPSYMTFSNDSGTTWQLNPNGYTGYGTTYTFLDGTTTQSCKPPVITKPDGSVEASAATFSSDYSKLAIDTGKNSPFRNYTYIAADVEVNRSGGGLSGCFIQNAFIRSTDGGKTWDRHIVLDPELTDFGYIQKIAIGPNGEIYMAQNKFNGIRFFRSLDGGSTFVIKNISTTDQVTIVDVAVSPSNVLYLAYLAGNNYPSFGPCFDCAVFLINSTDGGDTWSSPYIVSEARAIPWEGAPDQNPGYQPFGPERSTLTVSATSSRVFVAWRDWKNTGNKTWQRIYTANNTQYNVTSYNVTSGDYYAFDSRYGSFRLTNMSGRFCSPPNDAGDCTTFGGNNDFMGSTASGEIIYVVYGIDADNNAIPDGNLVSFIPVFP